jgi:hydrogenase/urease accessory protein HupE
VVVIGLGNHAHGNHAHRQATGGWLAMYVFGFTFHVATLARGTLRAGEEADLFEIFLSDPDGG